MRGPRPRSELWLATDSRLSGEGFVWDSAPKISALRGAIRLSRSQGRPLRRTPSSYRPLIQSRRTTRLKMATSKFFKFVGHLERIFNQLLSSRSRDPLVLGTAQTHPPFSTRHDTVVVGGFSRQQSGMAAKYLVHEQSRWRFAAVRGKKTYGLARNLLIFGDRRASSLYAYRLREVLAKLPKGKPLDLEPLRVRASLQYGHSVAASMGITLGVAVCSDTNALTAPWST